MNTNLPIALLLTLFLSAKSTATPIRYKLESKTRPVDEIFEIGSDSFNIKEHFGNDASPWLHSGNVKEVTIFAKSENGAGLAFLKVDENESPSARVLGNPTNFELPGNFHEITFDYTHRSQYPKWFLNFLDDRIKVLKIKVTIDKPIPRIEFKEKCNRSVYNIFSPGIKYRTFTSEAIEYGYHNERRSIKERIRLVACDYANRRCDKFIKDRVLLYCK